MRCALRIQESSLAHDERCEEEIRGAKLHLKRTFGVWVELATNEERWRLELVQRRLGGAAVIRRNTSWSSFSIRIITNRVEVRGKPSPRLGELEGAQRPARQCHRPAVLAHARADDDILKIA